jgi:hypothetical protein
MQEEFIKKGVIQEEQNGSIVKTASDDIVQSLESTPTSCCKNCKCGKANLNERSTDATRSE